jgi:outer membrane lipoprotein carrier protein
VAGFRIPASTLLAALLATPVPADPEGQEWARRVEARHLKARDMIARFTQSYRSGLLGREVVERGRLSLKRPGRMRWEYEEPEKKTFVSDGRRFYFYVPADQQVIVKEQGDERSLPALLLAGGDILSHFAVSREEGAAGLVRLRLTPKRDDPEVASAVLVVDAEARIRAIEIEDAQGSRSRFDFAGLRENVGLGDDVFAFVPPRGVDVVTE